MAWIKRNLFFLIGSIIALALMIVGAIVLFTEMAEESKVAEGITQQYAELTRLNHLNPHPGAKDIDNIKNAREQQAQVIAYIAKVRQFYQRIPPIPDTGTNKISNVDFATQLRITVAQLRRSAEQQSVILPQDYYFTFEAQRRIMLFDAASLEPMATHLGEIKAICDVLFAAKVNSLDGIRREVISLNDDKNAPDYLVEKTTSTPLADITPYEVTFRCFSTELGLVLGGFASSPNSFIVKSINVEPAASVDDSMNNGMAGNPAPQPVPMSMQPGRPAGYPGGGGGYPPGSYPPGMRFPTPAPVAAPVAAAPQGRGTFLNEKPFRVTLMVQVVKIKATK